MLGRNEKASGLKREKNVEIGKLKTKVNTLLQGQNSNEIARDKHQLKLERIRLSNDRDRAIHIEFKEIIKRELGNDKYINLIQEASATADANAAINPTSKDAGN